MSIDQALVAPAGGGFSGQRERRHYGPSLCCFFLAGDFLQRLLSLHLVPSQTLSLPTNPPITNTTHGITTLNRGPAGELPTAGLPVSMVDLFGDVKGALWAHQSQSEHYHFKMSASYLPALFIGIVSPVICNIHNLKAHPYKSPTSCTFIKRTINSIWW